MSATRIQPSRALKRQGPYENEGTKAESKKQYSLVYFDTTKESKPRPAEIEELGRVRRNLAEAPEATKTESLASAPPPR